MADVTALFGTLSPGQDPVPTVVTELEEILAIAKRCEVRALAVCHVDGGDRLEFSVVSGAAGLSRLIAASSVMHASMCASWLKD